MTHRRPHRVARKTIPALSLPSRTHLSPSPSSSDKDGFRCVLGGRSHVRAACYAVLLLLLGSSLDRFLLVGIDGRTVAVTECGIGWTAGKSSITAADTAAADRSTGLLPPIFTGDANGSSSAAVDDPPSPALFLFVMGIEGTGHHLFMDVYRQSPSFRRLSSWGFVADGKYKRLLASLFNVGAASKGLWSAPCAGKGRRGGGTSQVDGAALMEETVASLKEIDRAIRLNHQADDHGETPTVVAIGGIRLGKGRNRKGRKGNEEKRGNWIGGDSGAEVDDEFVDSTNNTSEEGVDDQWVEVQSGLLDKQANAEEDEKESPTAADEGIDAPDTDGDRTGRNSMNTKEIKNPSGMLSYPNFSGPCRALQYPDLDLLYDACRAASVRCQHVYIHRDPHAAVRSVVRRGFGSGGALKQMKLETTMLDVIRAQLWDHRESLAACWDYDVGTDDLEGASRGGGILGLGELLGWGRAEFADLYREIYHRSDPLSVEEKKELTDNTRLEPFMRSMARAMESSKEMCRSIYDSNLAREQPMALWQQSKPN